MQIRSPHPLYTLVLALTSIESLIVFTVISLCHFLYWVNYNQYKNSL